MRVADYIADYIYNLGVKEIFMVSGGGVMFLTDGIAKHGHIKAICNHHEQASAMGAVSYAKYNGNFGVAYVTTGCGGTNAVTGLLGAWQDSIPCMFISGQCKRKETIRNSGLHLRQFGAQEADIISVVESLTKYAIMINDPNQIAYHLDKAVYLAKSGRPGPVWLDVPLDVQGAIVDKQALTRFSEKDEVKKYKEIPTKDEINKVAELLSKAKRPVIIAGQGLKLSKSIPIFKDFIQQHQIPVVATHLGVDILTNDYPLFIGSIGTKGDRAGNMAVQNSDLVLVMGSRLSINSTGYAYESFAREAKIIVIDIDTEEHKKNTVKIDLFINSDLKNFLEEFTKQMKDQIDLDMGDWVKRCVEWKIKYPVCLPEYAEKTNGINTYYFVDRLSEKLKSDSVVVADAGSTTHVVPQGIKFKENQRYITSCAQSEMGYTIPATIGVCAAKGYKEVIGITGDGSFQMNIQELQTIVHYDLPIKIFVWNNDGYLSIRTTQKRYFEGRLLGTDKSSGVSFPSLEKIAYAYGIKYFRINNTQEIDEVLEKVLDFPKAVICEVMCLTDQEIIPTVASYRKEDGTMVSKPLEDMYPFLDREEFHNNMLVKPLDDD
jgi:acetolactate synthase I/II/III large subunit